MSSLFKYAGLLLVIIGIPTLILDPTIGSDIPLLVGLFMLFIAKEKREDERAVAIKTSSAYLALILGYGAKLITTNLYSHDLIALQLVDINHFLILVFAMALIIYYVRMFIVVRQAEEQ